MSIFVKCVRMPGAVKEVGLNDGATVAEALSAAEMTVGDTEGLTVNGTAATSDTVIYDGDRVVLAKEAKSA